MRYLAFEFRNSSQPVSRAMNALVFSGDSLEDMIPKISEYLKPSRKQYFSYGLAGVQVYNVTGEQPVEVYAAVGSYKDRSVLEEFSHGNTLVEAVDAFSERQSAYWSQERKVEYMNTRNGANKSGQIVIREISSDLPSPRQIPASPLYISFLSVHNGPYSNDVKQNLFATGRHLDDLRVANGEYWESSRVLHENGMNIIRTYMISNDSATEVWASISVYKDQRIIGRNTFDTLEEAIKGINLMQYQHSGKVPQIPTSRINEALLPFGFQITDHTAPKQNPDFSHLDNKITIPTYRKPPTPPEYI